jgi:teichuronic acid exporter
MTQLSAEQMTEPSAEQSTPEPSPAVPPTPPARHLDRPLVTSVAWSALSKWSVQLASWISTIALARILTAEDYGIIGMAGLFMGFVGMLSEMGVGTAVVNLRELSDEQIAQLNGFAVIVGLIAFALTAALALPLGAFFKADALPMVLVVLGTTFVITAFRAIPEALLQRELRFRALATCEAAASLAAALVGVGMAIAGFGYWSLVLNQVVLAGVAALLVFRLKPYRFALPRRAALGAALGFSNRVVTGRIAWYAYSNADFLVAGRVLGTASLGVYSFAWNLSSLATDKIASLVNSVTPAFFSTLQRDPAGLRRMLLGVTEALALVVLPVTVGVALVAPDLIPLVFGAKWTAAVPVLQLLSVYGVLRALRPVQNNALIALGETSYLVWISVASALIFPIGFLVGSRWGPTGVAATWAVLYPVSMGVGYARLFRLGVVSARDYLASTWPALSSVGIMSAVVIATRTALAGPDLDVIRLAASVVAGAVTYALALLLLHRERLDRFVRLARGMRGGLTPT